ncbi:MAG TPA: ABC transporter substrate-binding protein [Saprospiraceae bacterium]|nr:ABC transporter substrate-binding protein [Saprospiraceae bacterium]HNT21015.1 ABC transporter substrate-binding protein [Saprospiraceae bacterium]
MPLPPKNAYIPFLLLLSLLACNKARTPLQEGVLQVRLAREPDILNPVLSATSTAAAIENLLYLPLMDFDPYTQSFKPVLTSGPAEIIRQEDRVGYKINIRQQAIWDDGSPVTAADVSFTLKATLNPFVQSVGKRSVIYAIDSIEFSGDPRQLVFWTDDRYFLDEYSFTNNFILQAARLDSSGLLEDLSWSELKYMSPEDTGAAAARARDFAASLSRPEFGREGLSGGGPYRLEQWVANQYIKLKRKDQWWGQAFADSAVNFRAYPSEITYRIIPEEANAITALKEGLLDVLAADISPSNFKSLSQDSSLQTKINFIAGPPIRFVYLSLNNRNPLLDQSETRKALARLLDLDQLQNNLFQGYAQRIEAPFQPAKEHYHHQLAPVPFDIEGAKSLLSQAGWTDSNRNGTVDKKINNRQTELKLRMLVTPGGLSQQVAIHLQEQGRKAGVDIEIIPKPINLLLENLRNHDFEIAALADIQYPGPDDPYPFWHSESYISGGQNYTGFGSPFTDSIINEIRFGSSAPKRIALYKELQEEIYDQQAAIFLFAPQNLIAVNKKWDARAASVRPGYFINDFRLHAR